VPSVRNKRLRSRPEPAVQAAQEHAGLPTSRRCECGLSITRRSYIAARDANPQLGSQASDFAFWAANYFALQQAERSCHARNFGLTITLGTRPSPVNDYVPHIFERLQPSGLAHYAADPLAAGRSARRPARIVTGQLANLHDRQPSDRRPVTAPTHHSARTVRTPHGDEHGPYCRVVNAARLAVARPVAVLVSRVVRKRLSTVDGLSMNLF
jgi:hypothetical protein